MPTHITIAIQDQQYKIIKPVAFLSKVIEAKYNEQKESADDSSGVYMITLEDISRESFDKFVEFSEIYFGMTSEEKNAFTKDTYAKIYKKSKHCKWMNEIYSGLTNEQIIGVAVLAEKLDIKFLIHYLGCKLSEHIGDDRFFKE